MKFMQCDIVIWGSSAALPLVGLDGRLRREPCAIYTDIRRGPVVARSGLDRLA